MEITVNVTEKVRIITSVKLAWNLYHFWHKCKVMVTSGEEIKVTVSSKCKKYL